MISIPTVFLIIFVATITISVNLDHAKASNEIHKDDLAAPLEQFRSGTPISMVICAEYLEFLLKVDNTPACVTPDTKIKLIERDWGASADVKIDNADMSVRYHLESGEITSLKAFSRPNVPGPSVEALVTLQLTVDVSKNDVLTLHLSRELIDPKTGGIDDAFFVLINQNEVEFQEVITRADVRVLQIPVTSDAKTLEILGYGHYNADLQREQLT